MPFQYVVFVMYGIASPTHNVDWGTDWPNSGRSAARQEDRGPGPAPRGTEEVRRSARAYSGTYQEDDEGHVYFEEDETDEDGDGDEDVDAEDDDEDYDDLGDDDLTTVDDEKQRKKEVKQQSALSMFRNEILPNVKLGALKELLAPWDVEHWARVYGHATVQKALD